MKRLERTDFDVIVLGTGMAGTIISTILARHGHSILMLDYGTHPRFAIGESTIPQTSQLVQLLANQHDVPELAVLGLKSPQGIRENVATTSGIKRIFGFAYHNVGHEHDPKQALQFGNVWRDENHLFRQDIDAWLLTLALKYGCRVRQGVRVESVEIDDAGARVATHDGAEYTAKFVIDGTGFRSVLAEKYGLREKPSSLRCHTRSIFTHIVDLKDFEDVAPTHMSHEWKLGTLHHMFKRGWFWVIPFNNWEGATNPLASVGVTVDERVYPEDPSLTPEQEFQKFLDMIPSAAKQFADAQAIRPWIRTKRIQYSSTRTVGKRFALLSHAAGFVDPMFSRGLISTMENIRELADALLPALADDDFSEQRFEPVDAQQKFALDFADKMVNASYISWDDFELWNLWVRVWAIGVHAAESSLGSVLFMGKYSKFEPVENPVFSRYEPPGFRKYFEDSYNAMIEYNEGKNSVKETRARMLEVLEGYEFKIPLRSECMGQEWAMKQPLCRDVFLGIKENHARWMAQRCDAHLAVEDQGSPTKPGRAEATG
ncbi:MAG: tryptophan 7-halogenase [Acidobacteriota bacterium]|nr:tryptophan 7-halogenase [Acidobacteriota bacterium]